MQHAIKGAASDPLTKTFRVAAAAVVVTAAAAAAVVVAVVVVVVVVVISDFVCWEPLLIDTSTPIPK